MADSFDQVSIIFGAVLGIVITILLIKYLPVILKHIKTMNVTHTTGKKDLVETERKIRKHILRNAQLQHLAPDLCGLNDIYVQQMLYSHPLHANATLLQEDEPLFFREALSIQDVPELACEFPLPKISLSQALAGGCNIAVSGGIGSGKTACLSNLTSEILENRCNNAHLNSFLPILVHIEHLACYRDFPLLDGLSQCLYDEGLDIPPPEINRILTEYLTSSRLLILVDGLDEVQPLEFSNAVKTLQQIHIDYPQILLVTTCGPYFSGDLESAGFIVLPLVPPGQSEFQSALTVWLRTWQSINSLEKSNPTDSQESDLLPLWMNQQNTHPTFFDFTISVLSVLFHDQVPENSRSILPYLKRKTLGRAPLDSLLRIAQLFSSNGYYGAPLNAVVKQISNSTDSLSTTPSEILNLSLRSGLLTQKAEKIRFTNPSVLVHLLSISDSYQPNNEIAALLHSPIDDHIFKHKTKENEYIVKWVENIDPLDVRSLSSTLNHLFSMTSVPQTINSVFSKIIKYIVTDKLPLSTKIKFASIINYANPRIFSQVLSKIETLPGSDNLRLCAFFYGFLPLSQHETFIFDILENPTPSISMIGIQSLLLSSDPNAPQILLDLIKSNPERYGRAASELGSQYPRTGHKLIRLLSEQENTILRRFSLYGLRLTTVAWSDNLLDEMSRNDKAWIIRDAAAQAINNKFNPEFYAPHRLVPIAQNPLVISAASKQGTGISPTVFPYDLLLIILANGTFNESLQAFQYLYSNPNETAITRIRQLINTNQPLREIVARALYEMSLRN